MASLVADANTANLDMDVPIIQFEDWSKDKKGKFSVSNSVNVQSKSTIYEGFAEVDAIKVSNDSVRINPEHMKLNLFYPAEFKGERYLYKKISEHEIEVYGFAK